MGWNYFSIPKLQWLHRWSLGMDKWFHPTRHWVCNYLSILGLKLNHISERGICDLNRCLWPSTLMADTIVLSISGVNVLCDSIDNAGKCVFTVYWTGFMVILYFHFKEYLVNIPWTYFFGSYPHGNGLAYGMILQKVLLQMAKWNSTINIYIYTYIKL